MSKHNHTDQCYLQRCVDLANLASSHVSPNPRVGAVLVYEGRIIGEGYHHRAGEAHAEVNCVASVAMADRELIKLSTLYVSLEPCCFHGRTPACTSLILAQEIPKVVIGQLDQTAAVSGQGVQILQDAGVEVVAYPGFQPAARVAQARQLYAAANRPYILLKYAQSADGFLAPENQEQYWITNGLSRRLVHFWRSRTNAILIGAGTLIADNPSLTTRLYPGANPQAVIIDPSAKIQSTEFKIFHQSSSKPILFQPNGSNALAGVEQVFIPEKLIKGIKQSGKLQSSHALSSPALRGSRLALLQFLAFILHALHQRKHNHITVEGGRWLLQCFLTAGLWDEARVFTGTTTYFQQGLAAPSVPGTPRQKIKLGTDQLVQWMNETASSIALD